MNMKFEKIQTSFVSGFNRMAPLAVMSCLLISMVWPVSATARNNPSVCDSEKGRAFGLCNAYCEAMDCDWDLTAPENACAQVKFNYQRLTGNEELPCEQKSQGCMIGDSGLQPPSPFDVNDGNKYGARELGISVPNQCKCNDYIFWT